MNDNEVAARALEGSGALVSILVPIGFFVLTGFIIWVVIRAHRAKLQARTDLYRDLLTKFSSGQELGEFLSTQEGRDFLESFWSAQIDARERLVKAIRTGLILTILGLGLLGLTFEVSGMLVPGVVLVALGVGFLVAGGVSYRLSKKLDLAKS